MPSVAAVTPRKILPPPMTIAISTPRRCTSAISSAMAASVSASMPVRRPPMSASPESLRRMRLYLGSGMPLRLYHVKRGGQRGAGSGQGNRKSYPLPPTPLPALFLHVRRDFRREVFRLFFDALAELVAREARHDELASRFFAAALHVLRYHRLVVADVRLFEQARLGVELLHLAGDHLLRDVLRLAGLERGVERDLTLGVEVLLRHVVAAEETRLGCGDVHRDVLRDFRGDGVTRDAGDFDHDADLSAAVDVRADHRALRRLVAREAADGDVLLDRSDLLGDFLAHRLVAARPGLVEKVLDGRRAALRDRLRDFLGESAEILVASDEVGLAVHFDEHTAVAGDVRDDGAISGHASRLLARGGEPLFSEDLRRLLHVSVGLGQRSLHVAEAGAGLLAQLFDHGWSDAHINTSHRNSAGLCPADTQWEGGLKSAAP